MPVEVPVTPKLTPEVLEDIVDEGGRVDREEKEEEEGIEELFSDCPFTLRTKERRKTKQKPVVCIKVW